MQVAMNQDRTDLDTLAVVVAHSEIVVTGPVKRLLAGFDDIDIDILDWIAAEGRRARFWQAALIGHLTTMSSMLPRPGRLTARTGAKTLLTTPHRPGNYSGPAFRSGLS